MPAIAAKRTLRSSGTPLPPPSTPSRKSPRRSTAASPNSISTENKFIANEDRTESCEHATVKPQWNPKDGEQLRMVKEVLHVSTAPYTIVCREEEQSMVLEFCKGGIEHEKAGSLYICGCPGTGKSLSMEKVKGLLLNWATETGFSQPDILSINCTSLAKTSDIFTKILGLEKTPGKKGSGTPLEQLQRIYSQKSSIKNMTLIIADELDYLITKDRAVIHDLFMLTTFPFSRCILIGVANAIDLADRFLPRLTSLNCKPIVVTFRAYTKDQVLRILEERLNELPYNTVFQQKALELCARKVAAASGDMRNALSICRHAIEMLEVEIRESAYNLNALEEKSSSENNLATAPDFTKKQELDMVRIHHMALALSKTYKSPVVDTIQSLPLHQQIILCSSMKHFRGAKKDAILEELYKSYSEICKSSVIPPAGISEFSNMLRVLSDQGLIKLGQSREVKFRRVSPKVDEGDITFALQGIRFFRNCLQWAC